MNTEIERNETEFIRKKVQGKKTQGRGVEMKMHFADSSAYAAFHLYTSTVC